MRRVPRRDIPVNSGLVVLRTLRNRPGLPDRERRRVVASMDEALDLKEHYLDDANVIRVLVYRDLTLNGRVIDYVAILYAAARVMEGWRPPAEVHEPKADVPDDHSGPSPPPANLLARRCTAVAASPDDPSHHQTPTTKEVTPCPQSH